MHIQVLTNNNNNMIEMTTRGQILRALVVFGHNHKFSHNHHVCNCQPQCTIFDQEFVCFFLSISIPQIKYYT